MGREHGDAGQVVAWGGSGRDCSDSARGQKGCRGGSAADARGCRFRAPARALGVRGGCSCVPATHHGRRDVRGLPHNHARAGGGRAAAAGAVLGAASREPGAVRRVAALGRGGQPVRAVFFARALPQARPQRDGGGEAHKRYRRAGPSARRARGRRASAAAAGVREGPRGEPHDCGSAPQRSRARRRARERARPEALRSRELCHRAPARFHRPRAEARGRERRRLRPRSLPGRVNDGGAQAAHVRAHRRN
mmetsp:Transcript_23671/g.76969  ORF Transcript_23671/g.76969 Transcript_23671/m.76969 type:complete len:250 (+) Transcript_23671:1492-2241(+)